MKLFFDLLQNRDQFVKEILDGTDLKHKGTQFALLGTATFGLYGVIIGSQHSIRQAISSGVKLPILFLLTNAICLPALFVFSAFFGSRRSPIQTFVLLLAGTSVMGIALSGFAPVTLFFITICTSHIEPYQSKSRPPKQICIRDTRFQSLHLIHCRCCHEDTIASGSSIHVYPSSEYPST